MQFRLAAVRGASTFFCDVTRRRGYSLTFPLAPRWSFVRTEDWKKDLGRVGIERLWYWRGRFVQIERQESSSLFVPQGRKWTTDIYAVSRLQKVLTRVTNLPNPQIPFQRKMFSSGNTLFLAFGHGIMYVRSRQIMQEMDQGITKADMK